MEENELQGDELGLPDELTELKQRADRMGISYHPSIGVEKLREKIAAKLEGQAAAPVEEELPKAAVAVAAEVPETENQRRSRKKREASELIRVRITCMNPLKKEWEGEIITAGNASVGTFKNYVPFNADEGWHLPRIILNQLQARQCQVFQTVTDKRTGMKTRKGRLIKEFSIEILPQLTAEELHELAQRQAMSRSID